MSDVWTPPVITFDKSSYNAGDLMTLAVSGIADTETTVSSKGAANLTLTFTANGQTFTATVAVPIVDVSVTTSPTITLVSVIDDSGRVWMVSGFGASGIA